MGQQQSSQQVFNVDTSNTSKMCFNYVQSLSASTITAQNASQSFTLNIGGDVTNSTIDVTQFANLQSVSNVFLSSDQKTTLTNILSSNLAADISQMAGNFTSTSPLATLANSFNNLTDIGSSNRNNATTIINDSTHSFLEANNVQKNITFQSSDQIVSQTGVITINGNVFGSHIHYDQNIVISSISETAIQSAMDAINSNTQMTAANIKLQQSTGNSTLSTSPFEIFCSILLMIVFLCCSCSSAILYYESKKGG